MASAAALSRAGEAKISASRSVRQGFNLIQTTHAPLGSESAKTSLQALRRTGADTVALIPFFWQAKPNSTELVGGSDMSPEQLRLGIRAARAAGLKVMVKPHIWVPTGWAGLIGMEDDAGWSQWFGHYRRELEIVARVALEERAEWLCIGTEFLKTVHRPEWREVIASVRRLYQGPLVYMAHGADEVEAVPFWADLDFLGVTLYPPLGNDHDRLGWQRAMSAEYGRVEAVARKNGKQVWVGEIGIRSAQGAAAKPWESAEERAAEPVPQLQADVLATWLDVLDRESVAGILIWRWLSDPNAGGALDTDFTVQHKAAEAALRARWIKSDTRAQ
ncbi:MAG: glycoside hydrolase family 113 [Sphingobium sp.]